MSTYFILHSWTVEYSMFYETMFIKNGTFSCSRTCSIDICIHILWSVVVSCSVLLLIQNKLSPPPFLWIRKFFRFPYICYLLKINTNQKSQRYLAIHSLYGTNIKTLFWWFCTGFFYPGWHKYTKNWLPQLWDSFWQILLLKAKIERKKEGVKRIRF